MATTPLIDITPIITSITSLLPAIISLVLVIQIFKLIFSMLTGPGGLLGALGAS